MGLQRITRDPWSCAGLQDGGHWHCGLCWVARHSRGDAEVYRISRFGFLMMCSCWARRCLPQGTPGQS